MPPASRLQPPGSSLQAPGSSLQAPGSRLQVPGSRSWLLLFVQTAQSFIVCGHTINNKDLKKKKNLIVCYEAK